MDEKKIRRRFIVDFKRQFFFGLEIAVMGLVFWVITLLLFFNPSLGFSVENEEATEWVLDALIRIVILKWPLLSVAFVLTWIVGVVMGRRLFGPIFVVDKILKSWRAGEYGARFRFRKYDYIAPLAGSLNTLLDEQEKLISKTEDLVQQIQSSSGDPQVLEKTRELLKLLYKK